MTVPVDIQNHCNLYTFCRGCPLGTCTAPVSQREYEGWLAVRINEIRKVIKPSA